jgi:NADH dehydrogenase
LPPYLPELSEKARQQLVRLGVDVRTSQRVTDIDGESVQIGDERIRTKTVLWAAGVTGSGFGRALGVPLDRAGRIVVASDLTVSGYPGVFAIGDGASLVLDGKQVPGVAPAAMQEGLHTAKNIERALRGEPLLPFRYRNKGSLATIGRNSAVADFGKLKLSGALAWLAWLLLHLMFLVGFRNRIIVLFQWFWSFVSYDRGARLITGPLRRVDGQARVERPNPALSPGSPAQVSATRN